MAINDIVQYDVSVPLEILHPITDEPTGLTFNVFHMDSKTPSDVVAGKLPEWKKIKNVGNIAVFASCIESWDWGEHEFIKGEGAPELTPENAVMVLNEAPWIFKQLMAKVMDVGGFTQA